MEATQTDPIPHRLHCVFFFLPIPIKPRDVMFNRQSVVLRFTHMQSQKITYRVIIGCVFRTTHISCRAVFPIAGTAEHNPKIGSYRHNRWRVDWLEMSCV